MADKNSESSWKHGWPAAIALVSVVVAAGFGIGVIAGITWEEPGLVVGYLSGQTEGVEWRVGAEDPDADELAAGGAVPEPPSVAAPPPLGLREIPSSENSERATTRAGAASELKAVTVAKQPTGGFSVQVGAFSEKSAAKTLADSLSARGYPVYLAPTEGNPVSWRVRVGPVGTRPEAEKAARRLETAEKLPTWVLGEDS